MPYKDYLRLDLFTSYKFSIFIILLFHISGLIGIQTGAKDWFLALTPLNLLLSLGVMYRHENFKSVNFIVFSVLIFLLGYFVEVLGVNTGLVFGEYKYGPILGFKVFNTPLMIGVNWLVMVFCVGVWMERFKITKPTKIIIGGLLLTAIDAIIEPVAIKFNFWTWTDSAVPFQNYVAWFLFSCIFLTLFSKMNFAKNNKVAPWLLMTQIIFFLVLNLVP